MKQAAEERGYRATIEEPILDGAGSVDVSLTKGELRIACEISVTSTRDQELGNIEKCLAANYDQVILVSSHARHLNTLQKFITPNLELDVTERVFFLLPEAMIAHLDTLDAGAQATEETVRGYTVKVTHQQVDNEEAQARRQTIAGVIARSLNKLEDKS